MPATSELILDPGFPVDNTGWRMQCTLQNESFGLTLRLDVAIKTTLGHEVIFKENNHQIWAKIFVI